MGQEGSENKITKECLRKMIDEAINTRDICIIYKIEKDDSRYAQKYIELQVLEKQLRISLYSYDIGLIGVIFAILAIGISWILFGTPRNSFVEGAYYILGFVILCLGAWLWYKGRHIKRKQNEKIEKDIKFMNKIILKIEEKL